MSPNLSRRDFLKLCSVLPLASIPFSSPAYKIQSKASLVGQPNILIFVFDALSASHLPIYGYQRDTAPNLTRFAQKANVYHAHHSGGSFTTSGTASLLTGTYPWLHRAIHVNGSALESFANKNIFAALSSSSYTYAYTHNLLADILLYQFKNNIDLYKRPRELAIDSPEYSDRLFNADYNTSWLGEQLIFRGGETKPSSLFGGLLYRYWRLIQKKVLAQEYGAQFPLGIPNLDEVYFVMEDAMDWLIDELPMIQQPSLGYFHVLPPHDPYYPRKDFADKFQEDGFVPVAKPASPFSTGISDENLNKGRTRYDEYLAYADEEFGRLYDAMLTDRTLDNTVVIVTADHGELFERGIMGHVTSAMYEPLIHVPLLISVPGQTERKDFMELTSCVDILPTLAAISGQAVPDWGEGEILPGFNGASASQDRSIFTVDAKSSPKMGKLNKASIAVINGDYKLISYRGNTPSIPSELYNLSDDPEELHDLAKEKPAVVDGLQQVIDDQLRSVNSY